MIDEKELIMEIANWQESLVPHNDTQDKIIWDTLESVIKTISEKPKIGEWIPCSERLPENAKHKGAFCPKYQVMTKYGVTEGWYNPDYESWYILVWFLTAPFKEHNIDMERGDIPKRLRVPAGIVIAWRPLPEPWEGVRDVI